MHMPRLYIFSQDHSHKSKYVIIYENKEFIYCKVYGSKSLMKIERKFLEEMISSGQAILS